MSASGQRGRRGGPGQSLDVPPVIYLRARLERDRPQVTVHLCTACGVNRDLESFGKSGHSARKQDGVKTWCSDGKAAGFGMKGRREDDDGRTT